MKYDVAFILNNVVFPCARGTYLISERQVLEGVHAVLCAKEIFDLLERKNLLLEFVRIPEIENHDKGKEIITNWAKKFNLDHTKEVDISIGVADVLVWGDDVGIFEVGTTRPTKMLLLLKYIVKQDRPYTVHFWPYGTNRGFVFKNWY